MTLINPLQQSQNSDKSTVTARVENTNISVCPVCSTKMKRSTACGIPVYVCLAHRIIMPRENENYGV